MTSSPELVRALMDPASYPHAVSTVELVETHISWIFLTGEYAYKVKKPVNYGFVDFSTLAKRRHFCHREVALNRRLSPAAYLGVCEVRRDGERYTLEGSGETVDYAVRMRQMPQERLLARLLREGRVTQGHIRRLAAAITRFHREAETSAEITRLGGLETARRNVEENFAGFERYVGVTLSPEGNDDLRAYSRAFLRARQGMLLDRARRGRIRDCHGDLHAGQIYLDDGQLTFLDCIEFNDLLRYSDVAADIAFLAMDLDFYGRADLSRTFVDAYAQESGDRQAVEVLDFFKAYRACVRGKVTSLRLDDPELPAAARDEALATARAYFRLARSYTRLPGPTLVLVTGLSGTGKTTIARELARRWDMDYLSSDIARKELAGIAPTERRFEAFGEGIYSPEFSRRAYGELLDRAGRSLDAGRSVALDATFRRGGDRAMAVALARQRGAQAWIIECVLGPGEARRRLEERLRRGADASDARWELIAQQQQEWEPVAEVPSGRHIRLDTGATPRENILRLLEELYTRALLETGEGGHGAG